MKLFRIHIAEPLDREVSAIEAKFFNNLKKEGTEPVKNTLSIHGQV